ncbi:MAG TPA: hypothetical protein EYN38_08490 [Flavobacteriales bacterium]|nr:hypothetical protein [Flavobacteriales bacterium]HIA10532.1 hypothetical protein [Flavobacteriales bacterium]HIO73121.1 hypothetical protein [Flavobacteriales bacterium]
MAKHLNEGIEFPMYFYGQSFIFSLFEVGLISASYSLCGISDVGIKLTMLLLWTIGVIFFYKTLTQLNGRNAWAPLLITILLIFCPAWAVWSMKARGGYLTSFLLSSLFCYVILNDRFNKRRITYLLLGLILIIIYECQPIWIPGLAPIIVYQLMRSKEIRFSLNFILGVVFGYAFFLFYIHTTSSTGAISLVMAPDNILKSFSMIPMRIFHNMTGSYYHWQWIDLNWGTNFLAVCYTFLILAILSSSLYFIFKKKVLMPLFYIFALSVLFTLTYSSFSELYNARHLLPLMAYSLLMFFMFMDRFVGKAFYFTICAFFISLGAISLFSFKDYKMENHGKALLLEVISYLEKEDIQYTFCSNGLMQWQITFYSQERIISRSIHNSDRYPAYVDKVNRALDTSNAQVALVGAWGNQPTLEPKRVMFIEDEYYIYLNPSRSLLKAQKFILPD